MTEQQDYSHVAFGGQDWIPFYGMFYSNPRKVKKRYELQKEILSDETMTQKYSVIRNGVKTGEIDGPMDYCQRSDFVKKIPEAYPENQNLFLTYHLFSTLLIEAIIFGGLEALLK